MTPGDRDCSRVISWVGEKSSEGMKWVRVQDRKGVCIWPRRRRRIAAEITKEKTKNKSLESGRCQQGNEGGIGGTTGVVPNR
jgi:hypothetical protein